MLETIVEILFGIALFINVLLFIPQILKLTKEKSTRNISLVTFVGFLLLQFIMLLQGIIEKDYFLVGAYVLSILTCGTLVVLILMYNHQRTLNKEFSLEEILEQLPAHVYWKDKEGFIHVCSQLQAQSLGFHSKQDPGLVGKTSYDLLPQDQADFITDIDQEVMKTGQTKIVEEIASIADGTPHLYLSCKAPFRNKDQEIIGLLGVSVDITRAKQKLEDRLAMLENIIALMPGNVYWKDRQGVVLGCNDNHALAAGFSSRKQMIGKTDYDLPWKDQANLIHEQDKLVMETGQPQSSEDSIILSSGGEEAIFLSRKVPLYEGNKIVGVLGISFDITDSKKMEFFKMRQEIDDQNKQVMNILAGSIAHELRTPLAVININLDLLARSNKNNELEADEKLDRIDKYSEKIRQSIKDTTQVINMILVKLRHVVSNKVEEKNFKNYSMAETIREALSIYPYKVNEAKLVHYEDQGEDFQCCGDLILTRHILFNLIKNGLNAIQESGYGEVVISLNLQDRKSNRVIVTDTAGGIPADLASKIFNKFETTEKIHNGTGLGLAFCKLVMQSYEGNILCESDEETYTRFTLIFPKL